MITFVNKEFENLKEGERFMNYADFCLLCLNSPVQQGMTVKDINNRIKLMDEFKDLKPGGTVSLTEEGYKLLATCKDNMKWGLVHKAIPEFSDYVDSLKPNEETELTEKKEEAKTEA